MRNKNRTGFIHIGILVAIVILLVGSAAILTQVRRAVQPQVPSDDTITPGNGVQSGDQVPGDPVSSWKTYPSTSSRQAAIDTSSWKIYRNEEYRFEVTYPSDWIVQEDKTRRFGSSIAPYSELLYGVIAGGKGGDWRPSFAIQVYSNKDKLTLEQWIAIFSPRGPGGVTVVKSTENFSISGSTAKELTIFAFDHSERAVVAEKFGYIFYLGSDKDNPNDSNFKDHKVIYDQILSTFKFIDSGN